MIRQPEEITFWLAAAAQTESLDAETRPDVAEWVFRPCVETPLAPREARAALEILGYLVSMGIPASAVLRKMAEPFLPRKDEN
jgi:hypothetical protein